MKLLYASILCICARMGLSKSQLSLMIFLMAPTIDAHTTPKGCDTCVFPRCSKEDFCNGYYNLVLDPKYLPKLTSYFKYCFDTFANEPNKEGTFRRHMILKLLESTTPIVHKAYFDQKTSLKDVAGFIKIKLDIMDFNVYAEVMESDEDPEHRWKTVAERHNIYYAPSHSSGSYDPEDEKFQCKQLVTRNLSSCGGDPSNEGAFNRTKLIAVHRIARTISFPIVNITTPSSSDDTLFLILDMYIFANRCLSILGNVPCAECEMEGILAWIRKTVLPHVNIKELEKVYNVVNSVTIKS